MIKIATWKVAPLLLISGLCGLAYQIVWLRQLRLIFGSSTAATGMVLAVFMGGLGAGAVLLGRFVDRSRNPLRLYGRLEVGIAVSAMLSPLLIILVHKFYIHLGGVMELGLPLATGVRIILAFLVLGVPTLLMGGTLPAAARAVESLADRGRRDLALLYGINTLGGVLGVGLASFILLELLGNRSTLWAASLLNLLVGLTALWLARRFVGSNDGTAASTSDSLGEFAAADTFAPSALIPPPFIYTAAAISGFVFLLMELVWYRMLAPLLGGSTYTFSLILTVALVGIGIGGTLYSSRKRSRRPTVAAFAFICGLEAMFMAVPYALGDRVALLTALVKTFDIVGFTGQLGGWLLISCLVVLLPAMMAGIQFPLLIGLLGQGRKDVGKHTGYVYGWNTGGAILGALAGGFGLIPLLSAPGCWQLVVLLLILLAAIASIISANLEGRRWQLLGPVATVITAGLLLTASGPSATWRHRAIGGGGESVNFSGMSRNELHEWLIAYPRSVIWERDGVESSVALRAYVGLSFIVNGKSDGHAILDAGTQVMGPLVGAILHPAPKKAMVIGLGTGSSAGWLAEVETMEQVDVVELEPVILEVAKRSAPVNFNVVSHPKVRILIGDAREIVQTIDRQYDVIFSEPSNPYRAGIASLYTREFYESVAQRLAPAGIFSQWVQSYNVDQQTIRTICATLALVFDDVEIWLTNNGDMLFVCSRQEKKYPVALLRQRLAIEPFKSAVLNTWGVTGLEGFLAGYVGRSEVSRRLLAEEIDKGGINSDDRMLVEFGFARTVGRTGLFSLAEMRRVIREKNLHRPEMQGGWVDWSLVDDNFLRMMLWTGGGSVVRGEEFSSDQQQRGAAFQAFEQGNYKPVLMAWQSGWWKTETPMEKAVVAEALAEEGNEQALQFIDEVRTSWPASANALLARYYLRRGESEMAYAALASALNGFQTQPWQMRSAIAHALNLAIEMAYNKFHAEELFELLDEPFSVYNLEEYRKFALAMVGKNIDYQHAALAFARLEPHVPWNEAVLSYRAECYQSIGSPLAEQAKRDLQLFLENKAQPFTL